jgi:hypothetical protein
MWIYTSKGMLSIVQHNAKPDHVLVRARTQDHITHFLAPNTDITYFWIADADYKFRALVTKSDLQKLVIHHLSDITYFDFKGSIPKSDPDYSSACLAGWHAMNDMGKAPTYNDATDYEWTPCDHSMPEEPGNYLTRWSDGTIETFTFDDEPERNGSGWYRPMGGGKITHWMEVPHFGEAL